MFNHSVPLNAFGLVIFYSLVTQACKFHSSSNMIQTSVRYSNGNNSIEIKDVSDDYKSFKFTSHNMEFVKENKDIENWLLNHQNDEFTKEEENELASIIVKEIRNREFDKLYKSNWELSSVIYRNEDTSSYTNSVHRDLSAESVYNLQTHHNQYYYYNAWIPRKYVDSNPLGLILPNSVDLCKEPVGFLGLQNDFTGINYSPNHKWIYHKGLTSGDIILWHSEMVYHASFPCSGKIPRKSIDMRIYFTKEID